ncbi:MAG TPA: FAD-dependent oxidoreductase, partial [Phenylobacterium sp.]|nr:FAD-dependent oxidoreductase [Phenylobacterium sp.]
MILGGGFAGLAAARALKGAPCRVTLVDRQNHHCFQPLLYQAATAALTANDVAWPIREILGRQANLDILMDEVQGLDPEARQVAHAPGLKPINDAIPIRSRLLRAFERAEASRDEAERAALTTFVVVGGGPTGVEMAGAISDLARGALSRDFRHVAPEKARVILAEAAPRILGGFPEPLGRYAARALERRGVEVRLDAAVKSVKAGEIQIGEDNLRVGAVVWAAGVRASPAADWL